MGEHDAKLAAQLAAAEQANGLKPFAAYIPARRYVTQPGLLYPFIPSF